MTTTTLQERIAELMRETGAKHADLMRVTKKTSSAISQIINGPTKSLNLDTATALEAEYSYRAEWLAYGKLPKRLTANHLANWRPDASGGALTAAESPPFDWNSLTPEERAIIAAVRELLPDDHGPMLQPIFERAEHMRKVKAFLLERSGATSIASPAQVQHIPAAPYSGPKRTDGPERRRIDEPHDIERRGVVLNRSGGVASRHTQKRKTG